MKQLANFETVYPKIADITAMGYSYDEASNVLRVVESGVGGDPHIVWRVLRAEAPQ